MRNVGFAGGEKEARVCDLLPANKGRSSLVFQMIESYQLNEKCIPITIIDATRQDLVKFHDPNYVEILLRKRDLEEEISESNTFLENFGLLYDCPIFPNMNQYVKTVAGSSISSARFLGKTSNKIAINWNGGRHHCKKSKASGFCYVNDIVLSILELRKFYDKILYIDFDLHHGDGVETAFKYSNNVITLSVHRMDIGFFPGTGDVLDRGKGKGLNNCFNIPTKHGLNDTSLQKIYKEIILPIIESTKPDCLVIQCGCDGLNSDEHQEWNLTIEKFGKLIGDILNLDKSTLLLGGGGYNHEQAARFWTYLTSIALDSNLEFDILPDELIKDTDFNYEFWNINSKNMIDENNDEYIEYLKQILLKRLN